MQGFEIENSCKFEHLIIDKSHLFWALVARFFLFCTLGMPLGKDEVNISM